MQAPIVISVFALCVSIAGFCLAFANYRRDRDDVKATCRFTVGYEGTDPHLLASVVNAGRRPVVLRMWGGTDKAGVWAGTMLNHDEGGRRLGEHERLDFPIVAQDVLCFVPEGDDVLYADLWFEDTLGRRHTMKGAKDALHKLLSDVPTASAANTTRQPRSVG